VPRDYKKRAVIKAPPKRKAPAWLWLAVGLLVGAFVVGLVWLKQSAPDSTQKKTVVVKPVPAPSKKPVVKKPSPAPHKPRFEFYNTLPKQEIRVPKVPMVSSNKPSPPLSAGNEAKDKDDIVRYNLQIGSFIRTVDAEKLRAELAFLGIETRIKVAILSNTQQKRYRVVAGPYQGKGTIDSLRRQLRANGYPDVLVLTQR
jgi:cell division protein FtsN